MLELPAIRTSLAKAGFAKTHQTSKVEQFCLGPISVYLKKPKSGRTKISHPLIIHGDNSGRLSKLLAIPNIERSKPDSKFYHNANMSAFARRQHTGHGTTHYGLDFEIGSDPALQELLSAII